MGEVIIANKSSKRNLKPIFIIGIILILVLSAMVTATFSWIWLSNFTPLNVFINNETLGFTNSNNVTRVVYGIIENDTRFIHATINITGNITDSSGEQFIFIGNSTTGYSSATKLWSLKNSEFNNGEATLRRLNDSSTSKTLTFVDDATNLNQTIYIKLPKNAIINDFRLNLSSINNLLASCYQENTNETIAGDGSCSIYNGSYDFITVRENIGPLSPTNCWVNSSALHDGDWLTNSTEVTLPSDPCQYGAKMYINYTKPLNALNSSTWNIKTYMFTKNMTINKSCWDTLDNTVELSIQTYCAGSTAVVKLYCNNVSSSNPSWMQMADIEQSASCSGSILKQTVYEESMNWIISYNNITNPYLDIGNNGIQVWNYSGVFNQTNNHTENMAENLTTYLASCTADSDGYCNIPLLFHSDTNGTLSITDIYVNYTNISIIDFTSKLNTVFNNNTNCTNCKHLGYDAIPITFHSDVTGNLTYQNVNITYYSIPKVDLINPANATAKFSYANITCNATIGAVPEMVTNITLYVWNSTGLVNSSMVVNTSGSGGSTRVTANFQFFFPKDDTYLWNCLAQTNEVYTPISAFAKNNYTIFASTVAPALTIVYPNDNDFAGYEYLSVLRSMGINVTVKCYLEGDNLDTLILYTNSSGTWIPHSYKSGVNVYNYDNNSLSLSNVLPDGSYLFTCAVNQTDGTLTFANQNRTLTYDTIYPNITIGLVTTTAGSQTISFTNTESDKNLNTSTCKYSIYNSGGAIDGLNNNISFTCNSAGSATVTSYGTYNLTIYVKDYAGNENKSTNLFATSASSPSGGGGGGSPINARVVALVKPSEDPATRSLLDRAIIFARIYNYSQSGEIKSDRYDSLIKLMQNDGVGVSISVLPYWINQYKNRQFEVVEVSENDYKKYNLIKSEVIFGSMFTVNPANINTYYFVNLCSGNKNWTAQVKSTKVLASCKGTNGFECRIISPSVAEISYIFRSNNFTIANLEGDIEYISAEKESTHTKIFYLNVINLCGEVKPFGEKSTFEINLVLFSIIVIGLLILIGLFVYFFIKNFVKNRKRKT